MYFSSLSWAKAQDLGDKYVAILPLGSVEAHGPIGPLGTDYIIPSAIAEELEVRMSKQILVLPTLPYGCTPFLAGFPGTMDIGFEALLSTLKGVADGILRCGVRKILFLNGHGGNSVAIDHASLYVYKQGGQAASIDWWTLCGQLKKEWQAGHGGGIETSVAMAVKPEWVHKEDFFDKPPIHFSDSLQNVHIQQVSFGKGTLKMVRDVVDSIPSASCGYGDLPENAEKQIGEEVFKAVVNYVQAFLEEFLSVDIDAVRSKKC